MRGGCTYIDFKGLSLAGSSSASPVTIAGIYERIESCFPDKNMTLVNVNFDGSNPMSFDTVRSVDGTSFVFLLNVGISGGKAKVWKIVVTEDDGVYIDTQTAA